jgi:hypothetical protein
VCSFWIDLAAILNVDIPQVSTIAVWLGNSNSTCATTIWCQSFLRPWKILSLDVYFATLFAMTAILQCLLELGNI